MDLSKLSPAPFALKNSTDVVEAGEEPCTVAKCWSSTFAPTREIAHANAEFFVLARNAFDVMMRRGWHAVRMTWLLPEDGYKEEKEKWCVAGIGLKPPDNHLFDDPFTALVEADKWYRENVEEAG